jgi:EmrB/QacA subfamily drug resistance transporter
MAKTFLVDPVSMNVGMTAYLLAVAIFIPVSGWVAERFGAKTVFGSAIVAFTGASILCGLCNGLNEFVVARVLQGIGGAMMVPVGRLVVLKTTRKRDLVRAIAYITWPGLAAPIIGPPLGGFITTYASWRWIFFLNLPLGVAALAINQVLTPNVRGDAARRFDTWGFLYTGFVSAVLFLGMDLLSRPTINWLSVCILLLLAVSFGFRLVGHSASVDQPLLDFRLLKIPTFAVTVWGGSAFRMAIGATPFVLPLMFQVGFGLSAYQSGVLLLALFVGNLAMKPATTPVLRRFGFRKALIGNGVLAALTLYACCLLSPQTPQLVTMAVLCAGGLSRSMQFTSLNTIGFADVPPEKMSDANAFLSTIQQITGGMGIGIGAVALRFGRFLSPAAGENPTVADFRIAFAVIGTLCLLAVLDCFWLKAEAGAEVSGAR